MWLLVAVVACAPDYRIGEDYSAMRLSDPGAPCGSHEGDPLACLPGDTCISEEPPLCRWRGGFCEASGSQNAPLPLPSLPVPCGSGSCQLGQICELAGPTCISSIGNCLAE